MAFFLPGASGPIRGRCRSGPQRSMNHTPPRSDPIRGNPLQRWGSSSTPPGTPRHGPTAPIQPRNAPPPTMDHAHTQRPAMVTPRPTTQDPRPAPPLHTPRHTRPTPKGREAGPPHHTGAALQGTPPHMAIERPYFAFADPGVHPEGHAPKNARKDRLNVMAGHAVPVHSPQPCTTRHADTRPRGYCSHKRAFTNSTRKAAIYKGSQWGRTAPAQYMATPCHGRRQQDRPRSDHPIRSHHPPQGSPQEAPERSHHPPEAVGE